MFYNNSEIEQIIFNGVEVNSVIHNGIEVFTSSVTIYLVNNGVTTPYVYSKGESIDLSALPHVDFSYYTFEGFVEEGTTDILTQINAYEGLTLNCSYKRDDYDHNYAHEQNDNTPDESGSTTFVVPNFIASEFNSGVVTAVKGGRTHVSGYGDIYPYQSINVGVVSSVTVTCYAPGYYEQTGCNFTITGKSGLIK